MSMRARISVIALACAQLAHAQDVPPGDVEAAASDGAQQVSSTTPPSNGVARSASQGGAPARGSSGALQLETTQITGNRELPKVMVIVPWKNAEPAELAGRPINSLVEEVLTPIDRDVMRRTLDYYSLLAPGAAPADAKQAAEIESDQ